MLSDRGSVTDLARRNPWETLLLVILAGTIVFNVTQSTNYVGVDNFVNLFELSIEKVIIVVMMTFVIIAGQIDLSVASVMALSRGDPGAAATTARACRSSSPSSSPSRPARAAGLVQGVVRLPAPTAVAGRDAGRADRLARARPRARRGPLLRRVPRRGSSGSDRTRCSGRSRSPMLLFLVGIVVGGVVLARTALGRRVYVVGDNADVARYCGARTSPACSSGCSSPREPSPPLAGVLYSARLGSVRGDMASGFELDIITMVLLGGISIFGGAGTMTGVALAILIVLNVRNGLGLANVEANVQTGVIGVILITSVLARNAIDGLRARWDRSAPPGRDRRPGAPHDRLGVVVTEPRRRCAACAASVALQPNGGTTANSTVAREDTCANNAHSGRSSPPRPWPPAAGWPRPSSGATVPGTEPAGTTGGSAGTGR